MSTERFYTRNGHPVTILTRTLINDKPVVGIVHQRTFEFICQWDHFGSFLGPCQDGTPMNHQLDLIDTQEVLKNPPPKAA